MQIMFGILRFATFLSLNYIWQIAKFGSMLQMSFKYFLRMGKTKIAKLFLKAAKSVKDE